MYQSLPYGLSSLDVHEQNIDVDLAAFGPFIQVIVTAGLVDQLDLLVQTLYTRSVGAQRTLKFGTNINPSIRCVTTVTVTARKFNRWRQ
jgi:hypothetical protein